MSWLNPARWLLYVGLLLALLVGYAAWERHTEARGYDHAQAEYTAAALKASEAARAKEKALTIANQGVDRAYQAEKTRRAAAERLAADRLRDLEAALATGSDTAPLGGADDPRGAIIHQCTGALVGMDDYAQQLAAKVRALQAYASTVCVTP